MAICANDHQKSHFARERALLRDGLIVVLEGHYPTHGVISRILWAQAVMMDADVDANGKWADREVGNTPA